MHLLLFPLLRARKEQARGWHVAAERAFLRDTETDARGGKPASIQCSFLLLLWEDAEDESISLGRGGASNAERLRFAMQLLYLAR